MQKIESFDLKFDVLRKCIEAELSYEDRTKPRFLLLLWAVIAIFIVPIPNEGVLLLIKPLLTIGVIVLSIRTNLNKKSDLDLIQETIFGELVVDKQNLLIHFSDEILIDKSFTGTVVMNYEGYYKEVIGGRKHPNIHYGTKNQIVIDLGAKKKSFYIFLKGKNGRKCFYELANFLFDKGIDVKEYTRGERTYFGEKLKYREIQQLKQSRGLPIR
ncbi:MAG: hypothetical protein AAF806_01960 [Bacteroidota bacterium]